jgi:glycosyltransferase involved in cell wall biosynthesis
VARLARGLESASRRLGDEVVAVSDFTARAMNRTSGDVRVVPNGITLAEIDAAPRPETAADVVYVGRLIDEKRVDLLLRAAASLRDLLPHLRFGIIGTGPERDALVALAERLNVADRVTFHGQLDPPAAYGHLKAARLLVLPSIREGFGMAVAEAQAAGTVPIIVRSPWNAAPDLVRDGVDGLVVGPDADALAGGIAAALADPERFASLAAAARQAGATRDWDQLAGRMEAIYRGPDRLAEPVPSMERA